MRSDTEPMLETDHLDQLLETPAPPQPVVVVQYRNRGVPAWVFFPFVILVTGASLFLYHRMVVEKDRIQAARDRSQLAREIEAERALLPLVRDTPPSTTVLPIPTALPSPAPTTEVAATLPDSGRQEGPQALSDSKTAKSAADAGTAPSPSPASASGVPAPTRSEPVGQTNTLSKPTTLAVAAETGITLPQEKMPTLETRSAVPGPFAELGNPPQPPTPNDGAGSTVGGGQGMTKLPASKEGPPNKPANGANKGPLLANPADEPQPATAAPVTGDVMTATRSPKEGPAENGNGPGPGAPVAGRVGAIEPVPLAPLPTKEETQRAIEEEAAKKQAERIAEVENKDADLRARQFEEQVKFRDELRELLRAKGSQAGPEIAKLDKRYAYEVDPDRHDQAYRIWRFNRMLLPDKVKYLRSLGVPETTILEFMCSSLDGRIGTRDGPRDQNDVWVRAARQLLKIEPARVPMGQHRAGGAGTGADAAPEGGGLDPAMSAARLIALLRPQDETG